MSKQPTRRELIRLSSAGAAGLVAARTARAGAGLPTGEIRVRLTAGNQRWAEEPPLAWGPARGSSVSAIVVDPGKTYQEVLGFGAALTDAACYVLGRLAPEERAQLFREFFHPSEAGFNVGRICVGASDYARELYSYDEGEEDPDLRRFSIDHDRDFAIPMLLETRRVNPDLFLLASPWSPPGWMKANGSMLGGSMRKKSYAVYALYVAKFLGAYREAGVPVNALSVQNETDTDQDGRMPACLWGQEYEMEFVSGHLGPLFRQRGIDTKIWIVDHNYTLWGRAICELDDPNVNQFVDAVAWHGYAGDVSAMTRVHDAHPEKHMHWTEGGPGYTDPRYQTDWTSWSSNFTGILRNWARSIIAWNLALDESGKPNIGPFDCGGVVTIDSKTGKITRSGQYWAPAHFSRAIRRGARRVTNSGAARKVLVRVEGSQAEAALPEDSVATLTWRS